MASLGSWGRVGREFGMLKEFRDFVLRGNVIDLAVAVVIGAAFGALVTATVEGLITPIIAAIGGQPDFAALDFTINDSKFLYGAWINALISFLIVAAVLFLLVVRPMNMLLSRMKRPDAPEPANMKKCPECLSDIPLAARRCAFCTSDVSAVS